jgi:hypothetical protein
MMNEGVHSALSDSLQSFKLDSLAMFNEVLPLALAVLITITVVIMAVKWFKRLAGFREPVYDPEDREEKEDE